MKNKKLIIVDISSFIFRAFYAIRPLHSPEGTPVNAVHGVLTMLLKLLSKERPTHIFLARDSGRKTFRLEIYPEYKANRSDPPEDLRPQFKLIEELMEKMKIPSLSLENYEADDVIGSAVTQWKNDFEEVYIVSSDKDLMQFVDDKVKVLDTMKEKIYGREEVFEKMGVKPEQIVDYLSLLGDSSDNIPGVRGIGEKGAAKLLAEYGTLDECLKNAEKVANKKTKEALLNHADDAHLSKRLIEIKTDLHLNRTIEDLAFTFKAHPELLDFLKRLGLKSALRTIEELSYGESLAKQSDEGMSLPLQAGLPLVPPPSKREFHFEKVDKGELPFSADVSIEIIWDDKTPQALGFYSSDEKSFFLEGKEACEVFLTKLIQTTKTLYLHDSKKLYAWALNSQVPFQAIVRDTLLMHYLSDSSWTHELSELLTRYLGESPEHPSERAILIWDLAEKLIKDLKEKELEEVYQKIDLPLVPILAEMENNGIMINPAFFAALDKEFSDILREIERKVEEVSGATINLKSPKQVGELLFEKLNLPVIKKTKTGYSTDSEVLEELDSQNLSPIPRLILQYRELEKLSSTYVQVLPTLVRGDTRRVHTTFKQAVTTTGRLSSEQPNLQNIPVRTENGRKIRKGFVASPGKLLLSADYSQIELRLLAHFSEDPIMVKAFLQGEDIHAQTAAELSGVPLSQVTREERNMAKTVNFGLMYGQSSFGLAGTLGIGRNEAKDYITRYFMKFSRVKTYLDTLKEKAEVKAYTETLYGRKRFIPDIRSQNRNIKAAAERIAINTPIQGTAADIIKLAMISVYAEMIKQEVQSKLLLQVHDELIFEVPESEIELMQKLVREKMENVVKLKVPLTVNMGVGVNWFDLK